MDGSGRRWLDVWAGATMTPGRVSRRKNLAAARIALLIIFAGLAEAAGCAHKAISQAPTPTTGSNLSSVDAGRAIFTSACHKCHATPSIAKYSLSQWTGSIIPSMASKAGLSSADTQNLQAYVVSAKG